jgi:hypothetical protein
MDQVRNTMQSMRGIYVFDDVLCILIEDHGPTINKNHRLKGDKGKEILLHTNVARYNILSEHAFNKGPCALNAFNKGLCASLRGRVSISKKNSI